MRATTDLEAEELKQIPFSKLSIRGMVVTAATSVCSRLELVDQALIATKLPEEVSQAFHNTCIAIEETLQELISGIPDEREAGATDSALEDPEFLKLYESSDVGNLTQCVTFLKQKLLDKHLEMMQKEEVISAMKIATDRRERTFNYVKSELQKEIMYLRQSLGGATTPDPNGVFATIDFMLMLGEKGEKPSELAVQVQELIMLLKEEEHRRVMGESQFVRTSNTLIDLRKEKERLQDAVKDISKRLVDETAKFRFEKLKLEHQRDQLRDRVGALVKELETMGEETRQLTSAIETLTAENEALLQANELTEQTIHHQKEHLYVQIATLTMKLHAEMAKAKHKWHLEPEKANVDLARLIASTGKAPKADNETLQRLMSVTERPDDPLKVCTLDAMRQRISFLKQEVEIWRDETVSSSVASNRNYVKLTETEENFTRLVAYFKERGEEMPEELEKARSIAATCNTLGDGEDFREAVRTQRVDAIMIAKRAAMIHYQLNELMSTVHIIEEEGEEPQMDAAAAELEQDRVEAMLHYVRSPFDEMTKVESVSLRVKEQVLEDQHKIRMLRNELEVMQHLWLKEREIWVDEWKQMLGHLPPAIASQISISGVCTIKDPDIRDELQGVANQALEAWLAQQQEAMFKILPPEVRSPTTPMDITEEEIPSKKPEILDASEDIVNSPLLKLGKKKSSVRSQKQATKKQKPIPKFAQNIDNSVSDYDLVIPSSSLLPERQNDTSYSTITFEAGTQTFFDVDLQRKAATFEAGVQTESDLRLFATTSRSCETDAVKKVATAHVEIQAHVMGCSSFAQCENAVYFDENVAAGMLSELGDMLRPHHAGKKKKIKKEEAAAVLPKGSICPSCGISIWESGKRISVDNASQAGQPYFMFRPVWTQTFNITSVLPPTGDVTLCFTDIQSSTELWEFFPSVMRRILSVHNETVREEMLKHNGYEVKTEGDAFFIVFANPISAFQFATKVQLTLMNARWPEEAESHRLTASTKWADEDGEKLIFRGARVRMGLNRGTPTHSLDEVTGRMDYFGPIVNLTARISSVAHGGELIVGENAMRSIRAAKLDSDPSFTFINVGQRKFKGVKRHEELYSVVPSCVAARHDYWAQPSPQTTSTTPVGKPLSATPASLQLSQSAPANSPGTPSFFITVDQVTDDEEEAAERKRNTTHFMWMVSRNDEEEEVSVYDVLSNKDGCHSPQQADHDKETAELDALLESSALLDAFTKSQRESPVKVVPTVDSDCQCEPVVILTDEEFAVFKRNSPVILPLSQRVPSSARSRSGTPKKAASLPPRPSSAMNALRALQCLGEEVESSTYNNAIYQLVELFERTVMPELCTDPERISHDEDVTVIRSLQHLSMLYNVRSLLGLAEGDLDTTIRLQVASSTQQVLNDLLPPNTSAPVMPKFPFSLVSARTKQISRPPSSGLPPVHPASPGSQLFKSRSFKESSVSSIMDALMPLVQAVDTAVAINSALVDPKLPPMSRPNSKQQRVEMELLQKKVHELEQILADIGGRGRKPDFLAGTGDWETLFNSAQQTPRGGTGSSSNKKSPRPGFILTPEPEERMPVDDAYVLPPAFTKKQPVNVPASEEDPFPPRPDSQDTYGTAPSPARTPLQRNRKPPLQNAIQRNVTVKESPLGKQERMRIERTEKEQLLARSTSPPSPMFHHAMSHYGEGEPSVPLPHDLLGGPRVVPLKAKTPPPHSAMLTSSSIKKVKKSLSERFGATKEEDERYLSVLDKRGGNPKPLALPEVEGHSPLHKRRIFL